MNKIHKKEETDFDSISDNDNNEKVKEMRRIVASLSEGEKIERQFKNVKMNIFDFGDKIETHLNQNDKDYIKAFDEFMKTTVLKDFKNKLEEIKKTEKDNKKLNDIRIIRGERDFYRQEAIRLNNLCKELSDKVNDISSDFKFKSEELNNLTKRWKESENTNKQLIFELERNIHIIKELEMQIKQLNTEVVQSKIENKNESNIDQLNNFPKESLYDLIEKLKTDLKKEKHINHKIIAEYNKVHCNREKLETIFEACVEECKSEIQQRKIKELVKTKSNMNLLKTKTDFMPQITSDNFLASDKRKLIENFLMNEEVINNLKEQIFKKIEDRNIFNNIKSKPNDFLLSATNFKSNRRFYKTSHDKRGFFNQQNNMPVTTVYSRASLNLNI